MELQSSVGNEVLDEHILLNCICSSDVCVITVYCVISCARIFLFCCSRVLIPLCCILTLDANFQLTVTILFSLPILTFVQ